MLAGIGFQNWGVINSTSTPTSMSINVDGGIMYSFTNVEEAVQSFTPDVVHSSLFSSMLPHTGTKAQISSNEELFTNTEWVVMDANIPTATMRRVVDLA